MASIQNLVIVSLLSLSLAFHSVIADFNEEETPLKEFPKKSVVVEGVVYCQSCKQLGSWSLSGAETIPLAKVSVTCRNHKNLVFYDKEYTANEDGYFYAKLEGFTMGHYLLDHPLTSCKVQLISSPIDSCDISTNINNGKTGASLRHEYKRLITKDCDTVFYAAGPLAFRPDVSVCNAEGPNY